MSTAAAAAPTRQAASPWSLASIDLAYIAVFAALVAALSLAPAIPVGIGVPITLQTLGVALTGLCLGPLRGFLAMALYLVVGALGLPVFTGGKAGLGYLLGSPTGGYLFAFPLAALLTGFLAWLVVRRGLSAWTPLWLFLAVFASRVLIIWPLGALGIARVTGKPFVSMLGVDAVTYWPGDLVKAAVAALLAFAVHKAFPRLLGR